MKRCPGQMHLNRPFATSMTRPAFGGKLALAAASVCFTWAPMSFGYQRRDRFALGTSVLLTARGLLPGSSPPCAGSTLPLRTVTTLAAGGSAEEELAAGVTTLATGGHAATAFAGSCVAAVSRWPQLLLPLLLQGFGGLDFAFALLLMDEQFPLVLLRHDAPGSLHVQAWVEIHIDWRSQHLRQFTHNVIRNCLFDSTKPTLHKY